MYIFIDSRVVTSTENQVRRVSWKGAQLLPKLLERNNGIVETFLPLKAIDRKEARSILLSTRCHEVTQVTLLRIPIVVKKFCSCFVIHKFFRHSNGRIKHNRFRATPMPECQLVCLRRENTIDNDLVCQRHGQPL